MNDMPRIKAVTAAGRATLRVTWQGADEPIPINIAGWMERGGEVFAALNDPGVFARARVGEYGSSVTWDEDEDGGDLAIDAVHLELLAEAQRPFQANEIQRWQAALSLSNQQAADVLGVGLSTWKTFKAGGPVPSTVVRLCRAAQRDPLIVEAYLERRAPGGRGMREAVFPRSSRQPV